MTRFPAGDDPIPATVFGTRSKSSGALGLLIRGVGVAFICRARAKVGGAICLVNSVNERDLSLLTSYAEVTLRGQLLRGTMAFQAKEV